MQKYYIGGAITVVIIVTIGFFLLSQNRPSTSDLEGQKPTQTVGQPTQSAQNEAFQEKWISPTKKPSLPDKSATSIALEVTTPKDKAVVSQSTVTVTGKTSPQADVAVNEQELKANANGGFSTNIALDEGENYIVIVVSDDDGNYAEKEIVVTYEPKE
jgi:cytoskeletal protein RodZ